MTDYPTPSKLERCLKMIATEAGDVTLAPFRVDLVAQQDKAPVYSVMIKSPDKDRLRQQIGQILSRSFALGTASFMLTGSEAVALLERGQHGKEDF